MEILSLRSLFIKPIIESLFFQKILALRRRLFDPKYGLFNSLGKVIVNKAGFGVIVYE